MGTDSLDDLKKRDRNGYDFNWVIVHNSESHKVEVKNRTGESYASVADSCKSSGYRYSVRGTSANVCIKIETKANKYAYFYTTGKWALADEGNKKHNQLACSASFLSMLAKEEEVYEQQHPQKVKLNTYGVTAVHTLSFRSEVVAHEFNATSMSDAAKQAEAAGFEPLVIWRVGK